MPAPHAPQWCMQLPDRVLTTGLHMRLPQERKQHMTDIDMDDLRTNAADRRHWTPPDVTLALLDVIAERDATIAAALAWAREHGSPSAFPVEPFTFEKGVTAAATDMHRILAPADSSALGNP